MLQLTNNTADVQQVKLVGSITGDDNGLFLYTNPEYSPASPIVLGPFQTYTVTATSPSRNFLDAQNTTSNLTGKQQQAIITSGLLPEGNYTICVRAIDFVTNVPLSPDSPGGCTSIQIAYPAPPFLINPLCETVLENPYPIFNWSPIFVNGSFFMYDLYILKLAENQIPDDAMWLAIASNVGNPILIPNNVSGSYTYKPYDIPLQKGQKYAWCVRARDIANNVVVLNQGRSEVCTFTYQEADSTYTIGPSVPPVSEQSDLPQVFNLNNTSITGQLLYRYYNNENPGDPGIPAYNPSITVLKTPVNYEELMAMTPQTIGNQYQNVTPQNPVNNNPININSNWGQMQQIPGGIYSGLGKIQIDPATKYLYHNTYSNVQSEPLRNTSISVYLEYVAVKRVANGENFYFTVIPGTGMYYNQSSIKDCGSPIDPQIEYIAQLAGMPPGNTSMMRPNGSELLGTTFTNENGDFDFHFDLTENTGLLAKGPTTLLSYKFLPPDEEVETGWVNPIDMVSNPADFISDPMQEITNGLDQIFSGNGQLQSNTGWGAQSVGFNNVLSGQLNDQLNNLLNNQLNNQLNGGQMKGGPFDPMMFMNAAPNDDFIQYGNYVVHYLFKAIRIKVNDPKYVCPDVLIFVQPGEAISLPPVSTLVNSYDAEVTLKAGGTNGDETLLAPGSPISGYNVRCARLKSFWDSKPQNYPLHEAMDIQPEQYFNVQGNTPYFINWDQNTQKPSQLKLCADQVSNTQGVVKFNRLVRNYYPNTTDRHYFEVIMPLTEFQNYGGSWGSFMVSASTPTTMYEAVHSYNFRPIVHKIDVKLEPLPPEILLRTITKSNIQSAPLEGVDVYMQEFNKSGNSYNYSGYQNHHTDANGYLRMSNLSMQALPGQGIVNPYRRIILTKDGYKVKFGPSDVATPTQSSDYVQPLKKGQRYDFHEIIMTGNANVFGYVRDEDDKPVTALIQIADGPFYMTEMTSSKTDYGNPLYRSVPAETEGVVSNLPSGSFQVIDALNAANGNMQQFNPMSLQQSGSAGNMQANGFVYESSAVQAMFSQVSRFTINAPSGPQVRVVVIPMSDQYMADTFYVNIGQSAEAVNLGTFMVFEKAHRVKVKVKSRNPSRNGNDVIANSPNAIVEIGDYAGVTNSNGVATFRFTTPDSYFRVFVKDGNRVPVEEYKFLPISKQYIQLEYITEPGMEVNGTVVEKLSGNPIPGARVFCETGFSLYGPSVTETFTDQNGNYSLKGLPRSSVTVRAVKSSDTKTYVGQNYTVTNPTSVINNIRFELSEISDMDISKLMGFDVEITSAEEQPNNKYKISGAFVHIPANGNFRLYDQSQRIRFMNCTVEPSAQIGSNGLPQAKPENNLIVTSEIAIRLRLHNAFVADMLSSEYGFLSTIRVKPVDDVWGGMQGKVISDLESFRFSFDYTGKFYVGERVLDSDLFALVSKPGSYPLREFYLMDMGPNRQERPIEFTIHNFKAKADAQLSRLVKDTVNIVTKLYPELALSDNVVVNAGTIKVTPSNIIIGNPGEQIDFKLEQWGIKSLQGWAYSIPHGGIIIPKARISTSMADIPVSDLILRPTELIMPEAGVDLNNLMLGGNVTKLNKYSNVKAILNLDQACSYDLKPHWRFSIYNSQNTDQPACYIQGLPGFFPQDKINIGSFTVFSNNSTLIQPIYQTRRFYDVGDLSIQSIVNLPDGLDIVGGMNLGIPGMTTPTAVFTYTKPGLFVLRSTKAFDVGLEAKGKVYFNGATGTENYIFADKYFEAKGDLYFENDDLYDGKRVALKGKLIKDNGNIHIDIPKLLDNNSPQAFQYIPLEGGQGDTKLKVLNGTQHVIGNNWDFMRYTADLIGAEGMDNDRTLDYIVSGAIEVDDSDGNSIAIKNIDTPLGGLSIVFDWERVAFTGTLEIKVPIQMGTVSLNSGMFEIQFDGSGFYFDMIGVVSLPGLDAIADVNCGALSGYYPELPASVIKRHKDIMYLLDVPDYLKNDGIAGIYINANLAPNFANWSISIPVPLFSIGMGVQAGADLNFLVNFGSSASVLAIQAAAYARAYVGVQVVVCEMCIGALARFTANGTLQFAPQASLAMDACASFTMFGDFCGASFEETIGCEISMSTNTGLDLDVQWSPCGGTANKKDTSCDF